jgi:hypothetical protein
MGRSGQAGCCPGNDRRHVRGGGYRHSGQRVRRRAQNFGVAHLIVAPPTHAEPDDRGLSARTPRLWRTRRRPGLRLAAGCRRPPPPPAGRAPSWPGRTPRTPFADCSQPFNSAIRRSAYPRAEIFRHFRRVGSRPRKRDGRPARARKAQQAEPDVPGLAPLAVPAGPMLWSTVPGGRWPGRCPRRRLLAGDLRARGPGRGQQHDRRPENSRMHRDRPGIGPVRRQPGRHTARSPRLRLRPLPRRPQRLDVGPPALP